MFPFAAPAIIRPSVAILKPQDVFAVDLWTGDGNEKTIVNGIDLLGRGGSVWAKARNLAQGWYQTDTARGPGKVLGSDSTSPEYSGPYGVVQFNNNGYRHDGIPSPYTRVGFTYAQASRFHQVITWTGDGTINRQIPHNLGIVPGAVIAKKRNNTSNWPTWHRGLGDFTFVPILNGAQGLNNTPCRSPISAATSTVITLNSNGTSDTSGDMNPNNLNDTYFAELFAHDPSADGIVQCGSFTSDAAGNGSATLGWSPQYILLKRTDASGRWYILDTTRGWGAGANDRYLQPHLGDIESADDIGGPTATGFTVSNIGASATFIYIAIRAPY